MLIAALVPFILASAWLGLALFDAAPIIPNAALWSVVVAAVASPLLAALGARRSPRGARLLREVAWVTPCFFAPLSVLHVWALVPGNLGVAMAGFEYFVTWCTKYPNFGPVNREVVLGTLCVLGAGAVPVGFGLYAVLSQKRRLAAFATWFALDLVAFVPVFIELDIPLWTLSVAGLPTILGTATVPTLLYGPLLRTLPLISMVAVMARRRCSSD